MPEKSPFHIDILETDILTWLFPPAATLSEKPIWIDADEPNTKSLSLRQMLQWVKRFGTGLQRFGLQQGDVVLVLSTNHIFYPVAYFGAAGYGYIFSGCNPAYGVDGMGLTSHHVKIVLILKRLLQRSSIKSKTRALRYYSSTPYSFKLRYKRHTRPGFQESGYFSFLTSLASQ